jgi:DNA invertase Pin-like site-specific DNA recombinase
MGAMFFAVLAVAGQIERNYIREKTFEGQVIAAAKGTADSRRSSTTTHSPSPSH